MDSMIYEDNFAVRLSTLRIEKGVSAREMSLAIGQNPSYINRIENGHSLPSMQTFFYICEYLDVSPADFFDMNTESPHKLQDLSQDIGLLNSRQLDIIQMITKEFLTKKKK